MEKHKLLVLILLLFLIFLETKALFILPFLCVTVFIYGLRFSFKEIVLPFVLVTTVFFSLQFLKGENNPFRVKWIFEGERRIALTADGEYVPVDDDVFVGDVISEYGEKISSGGFSYFLERKRFEISKRIEETFDYPVSALIEATTLGVRYNLPENLKSYMLLSGTYPFIAVSGLHTGIMFGLLMLLFLPLSKEKRFVLSAAILAILLPFTGLPVSALRAYILIVFVGFLKLYSRKVDYLYILLLSGLLLSFFGISTGFVLSFLAVGGISVGMDKGVKGKFFVGTFPFLFTAPYVIYKFKVINLFAPVSMFLLSFLFSVFLLFSFISEMTLFKVELINNLTFKLGELFILGVKKLFVLFSAGIIYSVPPSGWIFLTAFVAFILVVFTVKKEIIFVALSIFLMSLPMFREFKSGEVLTIKGQTLNKAYFIAGDGQRLRDCLIKTDYVFPFAERILILNGNRIIAGK